MTNRLHSCHISVLLLIVVISIVSSCTANSQTPVARKGVTLAGDMTKFTENNFALLQQVLNTGAGVIGVNLPWNASTADCSSGCSAQRPSSPASWDDSVYENSPAVQVVDKITGYVQAHGNGAIVMGVTYGTPGWAACSGDLSSSQQPYIPPQNAADYGDFMYAMSERYSGTHTSQAGVAIGKIRDWVVYNEVNSPAWWGNTACNTSNLDPVYYYGAILNQAYTNVHHVSGVRVLAGAFTSYDRKNYVGDAGTRISTSYSDWAANTANKDANSAWISPLDFVQAMYNYGEQFDAIALHPYAPTEYQSPLATPPSGAVSLANVGTLTALLQSLYPNGQSRQWHVALTEYMQQSYYTPESSGWDHLSTVACPNYFCAQTSEANLSAYLEQAYGASGSGQAGDSPYVDYLVWVMWQNVKPYVGGIVRADGSDKNEGLGSGSVRATFTAVAP